MPVVDAVVDTVASVVSLIIPVVTLAAPPMLVTPPDPAMPVVLGAPPMARLPPRPPKIAPPPPPAPKGTTPVPPMPNAEPVVLGPFVESPVVDVVFAVVLVVPRVVVLESVAVPWVVVVLSLVLSRFPLPLPAGSSRSPERPPQATASKKPVAQAVALFDK